MISLLAAVLGTVFGLLTIASVRGSAINTWLWNRRYARAHKRADIRAAELRRASDRAWYARQDARHEQKLRHDAKRRQIYAWDRQFYALLREIEGK